MIEKMKAAYALAYGLKGVIQLKDVDKPKINEDELLIKVLHY